MAAFDAEVLIRSLIGGMAIEEFNKDIRERRTTKFEAAIDLELLNELYSLPRLESLMRHETFLMPYIDVFDEAHLRRLVDMQRKSGKSAIEVVAENFRSGSTIRIRDVDKFDSRLNRFAGEIHRHFAAPAQINIYLTPPAKAGFPPHFDITDAFVVQCIGKKEWRIFYDYTNMSELPLTDTNWDPERYRPSVLYTALTLCAGDVLYLPRGAMHQAFCTERESMHLTISIAPLTFADLLAKAFKLAAEGDIELRKRIPWPTQDEDGGSTALAEEVRRRVVGLADQIDLGSLLRAECHSFRGGQEAASSGKLESAISSMLESSGSTGDNEGVARRS
jgi:Cupin superfamily protein